MRKCGRQSGAGNARILVEFFVTKLRPRVRLSGGCVRSSLRDGREVRVGEVCRGGRFLKGPVSRAHQAYVISAARATKQARRESNTYSVGLALA
jgi:hypothetical protein